MITKNVFIQLTSAGLDTGNFSITDCNGVVVLLGESGGGSLPQATNITRDDMLLGVTCSVAINCDNVTVISNTINCNNSVNIPISAMTTSTTTTTTTSYIYGTVTFRNAATTNYKVDSVSDTIGSFYNLTGTFPISNGNIISGVFNRTVSTSISVYTTYTPITPITPAITVDLYKNGILVQSIGGGGTGLWVFNPVIFGSGDNLEIIVSDED